MTVVVSSNFVAVATRRALAARPGGVANVTFLTVHRLAEQFGAAALADSGRRPISAPVTTAAVRAVLAEAPGVFAPVADHPATEQALADAHRELSAVPDDALDAVAACSPRARDVVRIHRAVTARLSTAWYDEEDLVRSATNALDSIATGEAGPVIVHLLTDFTAAEADLLRGVAQQRRLAVNVGVTGDAGADAAVLAAHQRCGIDVHYPVDVELPCAARIVSTTDPEDEVREAVRQVTAWTRAGVRLGRIAIVYPAADPYARLLQEQLGAADIPSTGEAVRALQDMLFGRTLRALLALPDRNFRRPDVLGLLAGSPILDEENHTPNRAWERVSRKAGVVSGDDWNLRLASLASEERRLADQDDSQGLTGRASHRRHDAERADSLAAFVTRLRAQLAPGASPRPWAEWVTWTTELVRTYLGDERRRGRWPEDELKAAQLVEEMIDRLAGLDALGGPPPTLEVFRRAIDSELSVSLRRAGRSGAGVFVGHVSTVAGMTFDRLIMLGMSEGRFPARRLQDSLLPDAEREAAQGFLRLRGERVHDDHRHLLAALAAADQAVLSQPRGDLRRSTEQPASRWLLRDAARLAGVPALDSAAVRRYANQPWLLHVPSFAAGLAAGRAPATDQELRLASIARGVAADPLVMADPPTRTALDVVRARRSNAFTRFDGNLTHIAEKITAPVRISATALERWALCPRAYLFADLLGVEHVEEPEERFEIDALSRGSLIHEILERFICAALAEGHALQHWSDSDHERLAAIAEDSFGRIEGRGRTGRTMLWRMEGRRIIDELNRLLDHDSTRLAAGFRPVFAEWKFDDVEVALPGGHLLRMRGTVDRIDREKDGSLAVIDYKSGGRKSYAALSESNPHDHGRHLQLYVYGHAARLANRDAPPARADYWFTKDNKFIGYPITEEVEQDVLSAMAAIVDGIAGGVFPGRPAEKPAYGWVDCWFCTPDGLSSAAAWRDWERMRSDPALADYRALVEAGSDDDG